MSKKIDKKLAYLASLGALYEREPSQIKRLEPEKITPLKGVVAVLPDRDFVFHGFDVQRDLTVEQVAETVEIRMFQDAGLNPILEYKNAFSCRDNSQDQRMKSVTAAAISTGAIEAGVEKIRKNINYIDCVLPASTLPYALYNAEVLEKRKDVFIYYQKDSLLVSIFDNGNFIYGKTQDSGIKRLYEQYCALSGRKDDYDSFVKMLQETEELSHDHNLELLSYIREVLNNSLGNIKNILLYAARVSGAGEFDRVFIGSGVGAVMGLSELAQELFEIESHDFNFFTDFYSSSDSYVDQMAVLALLEGQNQNRGLPHNPYNTTIYERPGRFLERKGGKALFFVAAATIAVFLWPIYYEAQIYNFNAKTKKALLEIGKSRQEFETNLMLRDSLLAERDNLTAQKIDVEQELAKRQSELDEIHKRRTKEHTVAVNLADIFENVIRSDLQISAFSLAQRDLNLSLVALEDTRITNLLRRLVDDGYFVELYEILQNEQGSFVADLKVRLK